MKIGLFFHILINFGLVIGKVIYDIVLDALMELVFVGKREQVFVKYVKFSHLVLQVRDKVCIFVVQ